jgi:hypothetical protein
VRSRDNGLDEAERDESDLAASVKSDERLGDLQNCAVPSDFGVEFLRQSSLCRPFRSIGHRAADHCEGA